MEPRWLTHARKDAGIKEVHGRENKRIVQMHSYTSLKAREDSVPWCSSAVCAWMEESGIPSTKSAAAKSWVTWGDPLPLPRVGCVTVIRQKKAGKDAATGSSSGYHVALFLGIENGRIRLFGGNQGDMVKESTFGLTSYEVVANRWPKGETDGVTKPEKEMA